MNSQWIIATPILVAIIPVIAGIITSVVIIPSQSEPQVLIKKTILPDSDSKLGLVEIHSVAGVPATNMNVFVDSKSTIMTVKQISFSNISLPEYNNSVLVRNSPKFINETSVQFKIFKLVKGLGSIVKVELNFDRPQDVDDFNVYAIYDQGSTVGKPKPF
jgi:hypothetical protein